MPPEVAVATAPHVPALASHARTAALTETFAAATSAPAARASDWFRPIEAACSHPDRESGVLRLLDRVGAPSPVSPGAVASAAIIAPTAIAADARGTAAAILGQRRGPRFLARRGVAGLLVTPDLVAQATPDFARPRA